MKIDPALVYAGLQTVQGLVDILAVYQSGAMDEATFRQRWRETAARVEAANRRWEQADG